MIWTWTAIAIQIAFLVVIFVKSRKLGLLIAQKRYLQLLSDPPPPKNLRLRLASGEHLAVASELSQLAVWQIIVPPNLTPQDIAGIEADEIPPMAVIELSFR